MAELVIALDVPGRDEAVRLAGELKGLTPWMKVGLELFCAAGPQMVGELQAMGCRVFLDLKFHDIPNTVAGAMRSALACGADMCNVHVVGGQTMCRTAAEEAAKWRARGGRIILIGVTLLTSSDQAETGGADPAAVVLERAKNARAWGLDGVVCSAREARMVKEACGGDFICLCPGIRPEWSQTDDQKRIVTPAEAVAAGADYIVVGRPITRAEDPAGAARMVLDSMLPL